MKLDLDTLKKNCKMIHAFGLGFIQLKLSEDTRLHFYVPEVNKTGGDTESHNHRYGFTSRIVKGYLTNELYAFKPTMIGNYLMVNEACDPNKPKSTKDPERGKLILLASHEMTAGSVYTMEQDTLHMVRTERAITYLMRHPGEFKDFAQVVHHESVDLICPFSANMPEKDLWEIVEREINESY